jgi:hypothetical protein
MKRLLTSALIAGALTVIPGSALAAPGPTPTGWIGACNMMGSWPGEGNQNPDHGVGVQPGGGMELAMTVDNPNGNEGMFRAVEVTGASC